jgi:Holliday junction resolvase RusA-like endonuclease
MQEQEIYRIDRIPVKRRPRVTKAGHAYTDEKTKADMQAVREAYKGECFTCPVVVVVRAYKQLPKSTPKSVQSAPFVQRSDADNILKACLDGLNGVAYKDDAQVVVAVAIKLDRGREPGEYCEFAVYPREGERWISQITSAL